MGYRKISIYLNDRGILSEKGSKWGVTGNYVYSVPKRFKERTIEVQKEEVSTYSFKDVVGIWNKY